MWLGNTEHAKTSRRARFRTCGWRHLSNLHVVNDDECPVCDCVLHWCDRFVAACSTWKQLKNRCDFDIEMLRDCGFAPIKVRCFILQHRHHSLWDNFWPSFVRRSSLFWCQRHCRTNFMMFGLIPSPSRERKLVGTDSLHKRHIPSMAPVWMSSSPSWPQASDNPPNEKTSEKTSSR